MSSKFKLAEQCIKRLNGGEYTTDSKITLRQASLAVAQARNKMVRDMIWQNRSIGERNVPVDIISEYQQTSQKDANGNIYVTLPIRTLSTIQDDFSIFQVYATNDPNNHLVPTRQGSTNMYRGLGVDMMEGRAYFIAQKDRLVIKNVDFVADYTLKLIADATAFSDRDDICLPADMEAEVVDMATQFLMSTVQTPQDNTNDNVANG